MTEVEDHGRSAAIGQLASIVDMVTRVKAAEVANDLPLIEDIQTEIDQDPLEVTVRTGWYVPDEKDDADEAEYLILLSTGGPAVRITGTLNEYKEPADARLEYQHWGTPWVELPVLVRTDYDALLSYARHFYYGE